MSVEWGVDVREYKHEIFVLFVVLLVIKAVLAITGKMPFFSFSFVEDNQANTILNAGSQAAKDLQQID